VNLVGVPASPPLNETLLELGRASVAKPEKNRPTLRDAFDDKKSTVTTNYRNSRQYFSDLGQDLSQWPREKAETIRNNLYGDLERQKRLREEVIRNYAMTPLDQRMGMAAARGGFDGATFEGLFPWLAAPFGTAAPSGSYMDKVEMERLLIQLDKANHPNVRGAAEFAAAAATPNPFGKGRLVGKLGAVGADVADDAARSALGALASNLGTENDVGQAVEDEMTSGVTSGVLGRWGTRRLGDVNLFGPGYGGPVFERWEPVAKPVIEESLKRAAEDVIDKARTRARARARRPIGPAA
jgi:hypothetical protein